MNQQQIFLSERAKVPQNTCQNTRTHALETRLASALRQSAARAERGRQRARNHDKGRAKRVRSQRGTIKRWIKGDGEP